MTNPPKSGGDPLCMGQNMSNAILDVDELRCEFRSFLGASTIGVHDKATWIGRAKALPLASQSSRHLCRFLMLAAAHHARPDNLKPGLLTRDGVTPGAPIAFFNYRNWVDQKYATVEHVAPDAGAPSEWDMSIYTENTTKHKIGNLVLLPEKENQSIGNAPWDKKKVFYKALMSRTDTERNDLISLAKSEGYMFGRKTETLIHNSDFLHMLDPLWDVHDWTKDLIEERSENILDLAWEQVAPWLFYD